MRPFRKWGSSLNHRDRTWRLRSRCFFNKGIHQVDGQSPWATDPWPAECWAASQPVGQQPWQTWDRTTATEINCFFKNSGGPARWWQLGKWGNRDQARFFKNSTSEPAGVRRQPVREVGQQPEPPAGF
ncbi:hypothetical protein AVEN_24635-1 [Araneus ventricosus]|uniref:Uncharacterized protein n=1 Tax=Araneus ventricosus TaxID=182803 RepID=A0A4Y2ACP5_ARAVE|nr:hypothetical protein AVEN_24635-1 [Araneus ventricosus]